MKDTIIRGGFNVYPRELEEAVREAAVSGIPPELGEEVAAALRRDSRTSVDDLREYLEVKVAAYT
jgi:long-chain acyl-CoA synthetase